jgi:hypothetical protein
MLLQIGFGLMTAASVAFLVYLADSLWGKPERVPENWAIPTMFGLLIAGIICLIVALP